MTSELKCPFCWQELVRHWGMEEPALYCCDNPKCSRGGVATESSWQALIQSQRDLQDKKEELEEFKKHHAMWEQIRNNTILALEKDLQIAKQALEEISTNDYDADWQNDIAQSALEKIKETK